MTLKFVPPKATGRYALFADWGNERGFFKTFDLLSSAKLSYYHNGRRSASKILELVDGEWYVLYDIPANAQYNDLPWVKEITRGWQHSWGTVKKSVPMTRDEYAEWRVAVERERMGITSSEGIKKVLRLH